MRAEVFYWLCNMSIAGALCGAVVWLLGRIRRLPRRLVQWLWLFPFLRLCVPVGLPSRFSLMALLPKRAVQTVPSPQVSPHLVYENFIQTAESYFPVTQKQPLESVFTTAAVVWAVGAAALLLAMAFLYVTTMAEIRGARHVRDNVYVSDKVTSPAVFGVFRPRILLPHENYAAAALACILAHENAHIRRRDNAVRVLSIATACVHWFNPLVWVFLRRFLADMELACDETVLRRCTPEQRRTYAATLLDCAAGRHLYASAFGGARVRVRVERVLSYKKLSALAVVALVALAVAVGWTLLTNAA